MLTYPSFLSPDIVHIGPIIIRWYGLMYVLGFIVAYIIINKENKRKNLPFTSDDIYDFIFYQIVGVILGGRIGYILFYNLPYYMQNPIEIIMINKGGMAFHGALVGIILATLVYAKKKKASFLHLGDMVAIGGPLGLGFGRIGNFINAELYGRPVDPSFPLSMIFPTDPLKLPRHPSQLYESLFEGFIMFGIIYFISRKTNKPGILSASFLMLYGIFRFFIEYTREPDVQIGLIAGLSRGQMLCFAMILGGLGMLVYALSKNKKETVVEVIETAHTEAVIQDSDSLT